MSLLRERIVEEVERRGSLRAAAKSLRVDHVYLWRLMHGKKDNPGDELLRKLKLNRIVTITYEDKP